MAYLDTGSGDLRDDYPVFQPPARRRTADEQVDENGMPISTTEPTGGKVKLPDTGRIDTEPKPQQAPAPQRPTGGNINDPTYLDQLLAYYGQQPGVNPSVTNDPGYWRGAVGSGRFKGDENYLIQRFFQPEGAPEGGSGGSGGGGALDAFLAAMAQQKSDTARQRQSIMDRLMGLADKYSQPVTAQDPSIAAASDAYGAQTDRALQQYREQAAERAHAEGVPTGAFDSQIGGAVTNAGVAKASNISSMISDQLNKQRAQLSDVLSQGRGILSDQDQSDIQNKVADIDAQLKKEGLNLQGRGLDIQELLGRGGLDLQRLGLTNQNNQFYDKFASDNAKDMNNMDIVALLRALGLI